MGMIAPRYGALVSLMFVPTSVVAQEYVHAEDVAPRLTPGQLTRHARADEADRRAIENRRTPPPERVRRALERANRRRVLQQDLMLATQAHPPMRVDRAAMDAWQRITGESASELNVEQHYAHCVALAREHHVMSDAARSCQRRVHGDNELPLPLLLPEFDPDFANDLAGDVSHERFSRSLQALRRSPSNRTLRLRVATMRVLTYDSARALHALRRLEADDYDARLVRAAALNSLGRTQEALTTLDRALRSAPARPEAPFNYAQILLGGQRPLFRGPERETRLALAAYRAHLCSVGQNGIRSESVRHAATVATRLQAELEHPSNWSIEISNRPVLPLDRLPPALRRNWSGRSPMSNCSDAVDRLTRILRAPTRSSRTRPTRMLRPVYPPLTAIVGPKPRFRWIGSASTLEICRDRACTDVLTRHRVDDGTFQPRRALRVGRWYWRVRNDNTNSVARVLWVRPNEPSVLSLADTNGDGWPDVPLNESGVVAQFDTRGAPQRVGAPGGVTRTAWSQFAGDLDADGFGDVVRVTGHGLEVAYGSASGLDAVHRVETDEFITEVEPIGDIDANGYDDLVLDGNSHGLLLFGPTGARHVDEPYEFGRGVRALGDINGDGRIDAATLDYENRWTARALGPRLRTTHHTLLNQSSRPPLWRVGDVTGDGFDDLLLWRPTEQTRHPRGELQVFRGSRGGIRARRSSFVTMPSPYSHPIRVGDVNDDGRDDVVWIESNAVVLRHGTRRGLGNATRLRAWPERTDLVATRAPDNTVWLFAPFSREAWRLDGSQLRTIAF